MILNEKILFINIVFLAERSAFVHLKTLQIILKQNDTSVFVEEQTFLDIRHFFKSDRAQPDLSGNPFYAAT